MEKGGNCKLEWAHRSTHLFLPHRFEPCAQSAFQPLDWEGQDWEGGGYDKNLWSRGGEYLDPDLFFDVQCPWGSIHRARCPTAVSF